MGARKLFTPEVKEKITQILTDKTLTLDGAVVGKNFKSTVDEVLNEGSSFKKETLLSIVC